MLEERFFPTADLQDGPFWVDFCPSRQTEIGQKRTLRLSMHPAYQHYPIRTGRKTRAAMGEAPQVGTQRT